MYLFAPFIFGAVFFYSYLYFPYTTVAAAGGAALFCFFRLREKPALYLLILAAAAAGFLYTYMRYEPEGMEVFSNPVEITEARGVFTSRPVTVKRASPLSQPSETYIRQDFTINSAKAAGVLPCGHKQGYKAATLKLPLAVTVFFHDNQTVAGAGVEATVDIRINPDHRHFNPGTYPFPYKPSAVIRKIYSLKEPDSIAWIFPQIRQKLAASIEENFRGDSADLVKALTIGDTSSISGHVREVFRVTGLTHLLSVSGTHFGMLSLAAFLLIRFIINLFPFKMLLKITAYLSLNQLSALIAAPFIVSYFLISELTIPSYRSFITIGVYIVGLLMGRKGTWWNSLLFAAFVIELTDPASIFNISFLLSFNAVMFIALASERFLSDAIHTETAGITFDSEQYNLSTERFKYIISYLKNIFHTKLKIAVQYLYANLIITVSATTGTLPIVMYYFYNISLISVVANFVVVPVVCLLAMPLIALATFIFLLTGVLPFVSVISEILLYSIKLMEFFSRIPFSMINTGAFPPALMIILYVNILYFFKNVKRAALLLILTVFSFIVFFYSSQTRGDLRVTYLDVGQSDSMVIETRSGKIIVVDTGKNGRELEGFLHYLGKNKIETLFLTHGDSDHAGGFTAIYAKFEIAVVFDNGFIDYGVAHKKNKIKHLTKGDIINIDGVSIKVLHPFENYYSDRIHNVNNSSLVFQLKSLHNTFLFTGDIEQQGEQTMGSIKDYLKSDVLKVAHHGSKTSSSYSFLSAVSPRVSVISAGRCNIFDHPSAEVIKRLSSTLILRTDIMGAVKVTEGKKGLVLDSYRESKLKKAFGLQGETENMKKLLTVW
ncbi:MAG: DNA internalization-related competence protein ComEC/Rec2 [Nitrospirae bacterium YQR-1]